jgi:hypothetical protein
VFEFRRQRRSLRESSSPSSNSSTALFSRWTAAGVATRRNVLRDREATSNPRELPDVTGFLVVVLVTLGLFVVPVGATIMQGPAIVASILGR